VAVAVCGGAEPVVGLVEIEALSDGVLDRLIQMDGASPTPSSV
jgi:hypothetical protein